jgi:hypothetical protein
LNELFEALLKTTEIIDKQSKYEKELARMLEKQFLNQLLQLAVNSATQQQVNAVALQKVSELETKWKARASSDPRAGRAERLSPFPDRSVSS